MFCKHNRSFNKTEEQQAIKRVSINKNIILKTSQQKLLNSKTFGSKRSFVENTDGLISIRKSSNKILENYKALKSMPDIPKPK